MINLSQESKLTRHSNAIAAGQTTITPSSGIDMQGFENCLFMVLFGTIDVTAVTSIEIHTSSDDGVADAYTAIAGTKVTVLDSDDNRIFWVDAIRPRERYVKCVVSRGTADATVDGILAMQYEGGDEPTTHDTTVGGGELHHAAAEGAA